MSLKTFSYLDLTKSERILHRQKPANDSHEWHSVYKFSIANSSNYRQKHHESMHKLHRTSHFESFGSNSWQKLNNFGGSM